MSQAERREQLQQDLAPLLQRRDQLILAYLGISHHPYKTEVSVLAQSSEDLLSIVDRHQLLPVVFGQALICSLGLLLASEKVGEGYHNLRNHDQDRHPRSELIFADAVAVATRNQPASIAIACDSLTRAAGVARIEEQRGQLMQAYGNSVAYDWLAKNLPRAVSSAAEIRAQRLVAV